MRMYDLPDARGHFGPYGGVFVAETLIARARRAARRLRALRATIRRSRPSSRYELKHYVGRPSPIYHAQRLVASSAAARRSTSSART